MMKTALLLITFVVTLQVTTPAQTTEDRPLITVSGQAEVRVPPDEIVFTLSVESIDKDMLVAKDKTDASIREILAIARRSNIKDEEVQTSYISVEPRYNVDDLDYEQRRGVKREFVGYRVSKTVAVRLKEIPRFDALLSEFLKAGVTRVTNVEFRDSQVRKHRDQARAMAIKAAQEKAKLLAGEIGQTIGRAYSITENTSDYSPRAMTQNAMSVGGTAGDRDSDSAIAPGLISVTAQVTVSFRLQ